MGFSVKILGSGAAVPTKDRNPTAQVVKIKNKVLLLDCAEGTQMQLRISGVRIQKISHIFISHLHGDHYFGLIGLVHTLHLLGRKKELHIFGARQLEGLIDMQLKLSRTTLIYPLIFHPVEPEKSSIILDEEFFTVSTIPLNHSIPTCGFMVKEKKGKRKIRKDFLKKTNVAVEYFEKIKNGEDFTDEHGQVYQNQLITYDPPPVKSYAYCSDTSYHEPIIPIISGCDLLYHEATFMENMAGIAHDKYHSTAKEAATIALKAQVKKLAIGHFSARYDDASGLLEEAMEIFPNTLLAEDGLTIEV